MRKRLTDYYGINTQIFKIFGEHCTKIDNDKKVKSRLIRKCYHKLIQNAWTHLLQEDMHFCSWCGYGDTRAKKTTRQI